MRKRPALIIGVALALGLAIPVALAATTSAPICPHGYALHQYRVTRTKVRTRVTELCLRSVTQTRTIPGHTVTVPGGTTTTTSTVTTDPPPTTATVTGAGVTSTVTGPSTPPVTETATTSLTATTTVTASQPTFTTTQTVTAVSAGIASLAWCGGHGGGWSTSGCSAPPNPLSVPVGGAVVLDVETTGATVSEPFPQGYLTFSVVGPGTVAGHDQNYGLNPAASEDCLRVENYSGQAEGACSLTFGVAGSYTVTVAFTDTDGNYGFPEPITTTVNVG